MNHGDTPTTTSSSTTDELDHVRDILFGEANRIHDQRMVAMEGNLDALQARVVELDDVIGEMQRIYSSRLEAMHAEWLAAQAAFRAELRADLHRLESAKADRKGQSNWLIALGTQIKDE